MLSFCPKLSRFLPRLWISAALLGVLVTVGGCIPTDQTVRVAHLKFTGVKGVKDGQLKGVLATQASSKLPWGAKHYFTRQQFEADLKRIVAFYRDRGYPDAKVASFDVKLNQQQDAADITIYIDEGQPIVVEKIEYNGFDALPARHLQGLKQRIALKEGQPLDRAYAQATREAALDELKDHGYPYASVRLTDRGGSNDHARIVTINATTGTLAHYGDVEIAGNSSVSNHVVERQLTFKPGQLFRLSQIEDSQRKLYALETFQFANIEPDVPEGQQPDVIPTKITVREGKHRKVNFGVGYGSEEKLRTTIDWRHVNFFGGARTMQIQGRYSSLDRGVRVNFRQPAFPAAQYGLTASGQFWHNSEPAYTLDTQGGLITIDRPLAQPGPSSQRTASRMISFTYTNEYQRYTISNAALEDLTFRPTLIALGLDPRTGTGRGLLSSIAFETRRSTVENQVNARTGYTLSAHLEQAGKELRGDFHYTEVVGEGRYYLALGRQAVFAVRARAGSIRPLGNTDLSVPFFKRYFIGGANSLRGWGRFEVSPLSGSGLPIGGYTQLESSAELRAPIWGNLTAVGFLDAGNVWAQTWNFGKLLYDAGPGLRYNTPIGPIRVDLGYQLTREPGLLVNGKPEARRWRIHFSIGQAF